ncbi:MAG: transglycosylase domain-containing protein [Prevotella sp.]|nr:transglycosylase domain-containing protein [Prevotella sp.]
MTKSTLSDIYKILIKPFRWYLNLFRGRPWYIKLLSALATLVVCIFLYLGAVDINFLGLFGRSPSMDTIRNTRPAQASEVYSADGVLIGKFFNENRTPVKYDDVNPVFWDALIDTEDERFYHHYGIDFPAFFAALKDYVVHHDARGASTITQQLAKNLFRTRTEYSTGVLGRVPGLKMLVMKSKEWVTATKLEWNFTKEEILTMYANTVDFGSNAYGIKTACKTYFGIHPKDLRPEQAAVLVGMLKATTTYNPRRNPENAMRRRNIVLANMLRHGHLTQELYDSICSEPVKLDYSVENNYDGEAIYFRRALQDHLRQWCEEQQKDLYTDGLKIYTTLDTRMQHYAEKAATDQMRIIQDNFNQHWAGMNPWQDEQYREIPLFIENIARRLPVFKKLEERFPDQPDSVWHYLNLPHEVELFSYDGPVKKQMSTMDSLRYITRFMHCGFVAMEPLTGHVKAWVGDIDFNTWNYDKVTAQRQPGSTFKLFVYTEAMNQGMTPNKVYVDTYYRIGGTWTPHNANGSVSGAGMTLRSAFSHSVNTIAAKLGDDLGISNVARTAHAMGIKSHLEEVPSMALGASDVNLLELVDAYCTVVDDGRMHEPVFVTRILDRDGNELPPPSNASYPHAIPYRSAFFMQQMLMGGLSGTSWGLRQYIDKHTDTDFGGKTGTSNNHSDAWFVGISPRLVCGAWVGGEYRAIHFRTGALGQGGKTALPICGRFLKAVFDDSRFSHYHAKFEACKDSTILANQYESGAYVNPIDSIIVFDPDDLGALDDDQVIINELAPGNTEGDEALPSPPEGAEGGEPDNRAAEVLPEATGGAEE